VRTIKLIGLTALAALSAMALLGASSAMAGSTALCKTDENPCAQGNRISHVHEETAAGAPATLLASPEIKCNVLFLGDVSGATLNNPLTINGVFTYSGCSAGCTVKEINGPATITVLRTATELAEVTGKGETELSCAFGFIKCVYNGTGLKGHGLGALTTTPKGETRLEEQVTNKVKGTCPATAKLDLLTIPLEATYIST
jgi:hypothetical protein